MTGYKPLLPLISLVFVALFLSACGTAKAKPKPTPVPPTETPIPPTATPTAVPLITEQDSRSLHQDWGLASLVYSYDRVNWDDDGKITIDGDIAIDFVLRDHPLITFIDENEEKYFKIDTLLPKGNSAAKVVFTTSEADDGHAMIPRFTPRLVNTSDSTASYFTVERFHNYDETYSFKIGLALRGFGNVVMVDSDIFYDGSEHHIYGKVELFGVKFENESKEPLVFKITDGKYVHVKGSGIAALGDGSVIQFSE